MILSALKRFLSNKFNLINNKKLLAAKSIMEITGHMELPWRYKELMPYINPI